MKQHMKEYGELYSIIGKLLIFIVGLSAIFSTIDLIINDRVIYERQCSASVRILKTDGEPDDNGRVEVFDNRYWRTTMRLSWEAAKQWCDKEGR